MKTTGFILCTALLLTACNYSEREQKLKDLSIQDSVLLDQARKKDSSVTSYIHSMNLIQNNLDSIKQKEKLLSARTSEGMPTTDRIIGDIKQMDDLILKNNRELAVLQSNIRKMGKKDMGLEQVVAHLNNEVADRDIGITSLQHQLAQSNESMKGVIQQFNDSMASMNVERAVNNSLANEVNTVYYAVGTLKELKQKGVIDKRGGIIGVGSMPELKQNFNSKYFTKADKITLVTIPLYARFSKIVTDQPAVAFTVKGSTKSDSLVITDPNAFWNADKYLVVVVK